MLSNLVQLEHVVAGKVCRFICENTTETCAIKEALFHMGKFIEAVEEAAKAQNTTSPIDPQAPIETTEQIDTPVQETPQE